MAACGTCGEQNPPSANFCLACGAPLARATPAPPSARKTVTVVFCDVAGSTQLGEQLDPESLRRVMSRWFEAMSDVLRSHGGAVEKFIGDAVMAVFGVPQLHEDDALRAVRAATEMRAALAILNDEVERDWGVRIQIRTGINTGEVIAGDPAAGHTFVTGDAVNVAKRLEQAARPSEILLGEATRRLVENAAVVEPRDALTVKGKVDAVEAWSLLAVIEGAAAVARRLDAPLVGRRDELHALRESFERVVRERSCRIVTVVGTAGIGKSRLAAELRTSVAGEARVLQGRCLPYGDGITFWPLVQIADSLGGVDALEHLLRDETDGALVVEHMRAALGGGPVPAGGGEVFWAVRRVLESVARAQPVVVVVEDIHWAEPTFLDLLEYLVGWTRDVPVLLLALARPELLDARPAWLTAPSASGVALGPLTDDEAKALLDELSQEWPLDQAARERIAGGAEGNPLYVEQMAAMVGEGGADIGAIPPTIQALLAARLDRLPPEERAVLERAAVAGKEFARSAITALSPELERPEVHARLLSLMRKELLAASPLSPEDSYRFRHALIRDAAYAGIPKELRAEQHERFADWAAATAAGRAGGLDEIVGYHLEQGYRFRTELGARDEHTRDLGDRAGDLLARAGRRAFARDDMPAASRLLRRAASILPPSSPSRVVVLLELGGALWECGDAAAAETALLESIECAIAAGDQVHEWYGRIELASRRQPRLGTGTEEMARVATEALAVFGELEDHVGLARAHRRLAIVAFARCRYGDAVRSSELALTYARSGGDASEEARIVDALCTSLLFGPTPAAEAIARCLEILGEAAGNVVLEAGVASTLSGLHALEGSFDAAREWGERAATVYDELGLRLMRAGLSGILGTVEALAGDLDAAESELRCGLETFVEAEGAYLGYQAARLAEILVVAGRYDEAELYLSLSEERASPDDTLTIILQQTVRARRLSARGERAARDEARLAVQTARTADAPNIQADALLVLASILVVEDDDEAAEAARESLELYERKGNAVGAARAAALAAGAAVEVPIVTRYRPRKRPGGNNV